MNVLQILPIHVRIDLGRSNVCVSEHFLNGSEIGAAFEQVRSKRMAERVWCDPFLQARSINVFAQDLPHTHACEWTTLGIQEHAAIAVGAGNAWTELTQVHVDGTDGSAADRNDALLGAFAEDRGQPFVERQVAQLE